MTVEAIRAADSRAQAYIWAPWSYTVTISADVAVARQHMRMWDRSW